MTRNVPKLVTVFGGSGFVGTQLVQLLARRGYRIRVAVRRPDLAGEARMLGNVGQIVPIQANLRNAASVERAVAGADMVVNLVGIGHEAGKQRFSAIHVEGAAAVARAARAAGAEALVHMSVLGADRAAEASPWARSRLDGEAAVLAEYRGAVILRPSLIFGKADSFFNLMGSLARILPAMPLVAGETRFQPVYVGDVAEALLLAAEGRVKTGRVYELGGPDIETHRQLLGRILREAGRERPMVPVPAGLAKFGATLLSVLPFRPLITPDQVELLRVDNVVSEAATREKRTLAAFGIAPTSMDTILPTYMWRFRKNGQFDRENTSADGGVAA